MRPRLAPGFTVMTDAGAVWLIAGEDVRYRLGTTDPAALAGVLATCDGSRTLDELGERDTLARLIEERVLVDGTAQQAHVPVRGSRASGSGPLVERLRGDGDVEVFVQDSLDYRALLAKNREARAARRRWMWITTGPGGRAYVGPLLVPDAGPCAACLVVHFKRLSPVPELYDVVLAHAGPIAPAVMPPAAIDVVAALARWKLSLDGHLAALYTLHVVELADLTVSAHAPLVDPECTECRDR